eukprot:comp12160_c0_seq1/m.6913 comp12160_c0_seq1/g.6913  ORF comp12160_c0_seq1/g.6913 comp12160_c0_seq1/m.6913 type:complete len:366 (-) comp12160_c0_seq1:578-1675(-)
MFRGSAVVSSSWRAFSRSAPAHHTFRNTSCVGAALSARMFSARSVCLLAGATRKVQPKNECLSSCKATFPRRWFNTRGNRQYEYFDQRQQPSGDVFRRRRNFLIGMGLFMVGYYVAHLDRAPYTGRIRFIAMSPEQELRTGEYAYRQVMERYKGQILPANHPVTRYVRDVGERIAAVSGLEHLDWEFYVINDPTANCMVLPGGKVFLFTGMLPIVSEPDALAAVLGHEIAHQVARHVAEKQSFLSFVGFFEIFAVVFFNVPFLLERALSQLAIELPFSRKTELEADHIGMILMSKACFNPAAAVTVWRAMDKLKGANPPAFMSTHPSNEQRFEINLSYLPEAEKIREKSCPHLHGFQQAYSGRFW